MASDHGLLFEQLIAYPTLCRHVNAFSRDLQIINQSGWQRPS
jgi:hypothetical protein